MPPNEARLQIAIWKQTIPEEKFFFSIKTNPKSTVMHIGLPDLRCHVFNPHFVPPLTTHIQPSKGVAAAQQTSHAGHGNPPIKPPKSLNHRAASVVLAVGRGNGLSTRMMLGGAGDLISVLGCFICVSQKIFGLFSEAGMASAAAGNIVGTFQSVKFKSGLALKM
jgi:hypothetical protein